MTSHDHEAHAHALEKEKCRRAKDWHRHWVTGGGSSPRSNEEEAVALREDIQPLTYRVGHAGQGPSAKWCAPNSGPSIRTNVGMFATSTNLRNVGSLVTKQIGEPTSRNTTKALRIRIPEQPPGASYPTKMQELGSDRRAMGFCCKWGSDADEPRPSPRIFGNPDKLPSEKKPFLPHSGEYYGKKHYLTHIRDGYRVSGAFGASMYGER